MPPKKSGARAGPGPVALALEAANVKQSQDIPDELLLQIYRLKDVRETSPQIIDDDDIQNSNDERLQGTSRPKHIPFKPIHHFKACPNVWDSDQHIQEALARSAGKKTASVDSRKRKGTADSGFDKGKSPQPSINAKCNPKDCQDNPRCLNWLGQARWEDTNKAFKTFAKQWGLGDDPSEEEREPELPVGLKNLGATCYINSFLQVWYRDQVFRRGVYACQPSPRKPPIQQPLYQLQVLFAALQDGPLRAYNPTQLVKALKLDDQEQQDAQEFAKLFLELLDREFKQQSDAAVRELVTSQFEGQMAYGTKCKGCRSTSEQITSYRELEVTIRRPGLLEDLLHTMLQTETLQGQNKYLCARCNSLQNAERYTKIVSLPPTLHFSLMRFYYDRDKEERRKSSAPVTFPRSIDMSEFIEDQLEVEEEPIVYDLKAILSHEGTSAYHGHYTAQIYDAHNKSWYKFDDESVYQEDLSEVQSKTSNTDKARIREKTPTQSERMRATFSSDEDEPVIVRSRPSEPNGRDRKSKGNDIGSKDNARNNRNGHVQNDPIVVVDSEEEPEHKRPRRDVSSRQDKAGEDNYSDTAKYSTSQDAASSSRIKSKDAYMLVYVRRDPAESHSAMEESNGGAVINIPDAAKQELLRLQDTQLTDMQRYSKDEKRCRADFDRILAGKRSVYGSWQEDGEDEQSLIVDAEKLAAWLTAELDGRPKPKKTKIKVNNHADETDTPRESKVFAGEGAATQHHQDDIGCDRPAQSDIDVVHDPLPDGFPIDENPDFGGQSNAEVARAQGRGLFPEKLRAAATDREIFSCKQIDNQRLLCVHAKVDPKCAATMKRISESAMYSLQELGVVIEPHLKTHNALCRQCVWRPHAVEYDYKTHADHLRQWNNLGKGHDSPVWVSKRWLEDWRSDKPKSISRNGEAAGPDADEYESDILCAHGSLGPTVGKTGCLITGRQAGFLSKLFKSWAPVPQDETTCEECAADQHILNEQRREDMHVARNEKTDFQRLAQIGLHAIAHNSDYAPRNSAEVCYAMPSVWLEAWREWVKKPSSTCRPGRIDLSPYFCEHGHLLADLAFPPDRRLFEMIPLHEWEKLVHSHQRTGPHQIQVKYRQLAGWNSLLPVCANCRDARTLRKTSSRRNFSQITIYIDFLATEAFDVDGQPQRENMAKTDASTCTYESSPRDAKRRSTRLRQGPLSFDKKVDRPDLPKGFKLEVKKDTTLKDIRLEVCEITRIPVIYQKVFYRGREIEDAAETVESIGITEHETLYVVKFEAHDQDIDISTLRDVDPAKSRKSGDKSRSRSRSEGFGGTGLLGAESSLDEINRQIQLAESREVSCQHCTLRNPAGAVVCDACGGVL